MADSEYEGKVIKIIPKKATGFVAKYDAPNDPKGYVFYFSDCRFDANELEVGDSLYYQFYPGDENRVTPIRFRKKNNKNNNYYKEKKKIHNSRKFKPKWHPKYMAIVFFGKIERFIDDTSGYILRMTSKKKSQSLYFCIPHKMPLGDRNRLKIGSWIKFKIGTDMNSTRKNKLVAYDIELSSDPRNVYQELKLYKGEIIKLPSDPKKGWLYCLEIDQMFAFEANSINVVLDKQSIVWFKIDKNGYAKHIIPCATKSQNEILQCLTQSKETKYNAPFYIKDTHLSQLENQNHEFKSYSPFFRGIVDVESIIEIGEKYINAFMNSTGGIIYFGIKDDGLIVGQSYMTRAKLDQIQIGITNKLKLWNPKVYNIEAFIKTEFIDVCDKGGGVLPEVKVIKITVDCVHDNNGNKIIHETRNGTKWIKKLSCVGLVHYNDIEGHFQNNHDLDTQCYNEDSDNIDNDNHDKYDKNPADHVNVEDMDIDEFYDDDNENIDYNANENIDYNDNENIDYNDNENIDYNDNKEHDINDNNNNNANHEDIKCKKCNKKIDSSLVFSTDRSCGHQYCKLCCNEIVSNFKEKHQWPKCLICSIDFDENDLKKVLGNDETLLLNMIIAQQFL